MSRESDFENLVALCQRTHEETRRLAVRAVDGYLVVRNWLFGWYIVEYEQNGIDRAEYGAQTLKNLSVTLKSSIGRGYSLRSLEQIRRFYLQSQEAVPQIRNTQTPSAFFTAAQIPQKVSAKLASASSSDESPSIRPSALDQSVSPLSSVSHSLENAITLLEGRFSLGWSHYVALLTLDNAKTRSFHEIEAAENGWSVRGLERQIASSLYERLALSRDKAEVRRLSSEGQVVEKPSDLIKNPLVLEFPLRQSRSHLHNMWLIWT